MAGSEVPMTALAAFGAAWLCGLALFAALFVLTRRLGLAWRKTGLWVWGLEAEDIKRVFGLIYGSQSRLEAAGVVGLVWGVRALWLGMVACVAVFGMILTGTA